MNFTRVTAFILSISAYGFAIETISNRILQNQDGSFTLVCELESSLQQNVTLSAGGHIFVTVGHDFHPITAPNVTVEISTYKEHGLHIAMEIPPTYAGQEFTCSSTISSSTFRLQTNFAQSKYGSGTREPPPDELGITVNPGYLEYTSNAHKRVSAQFLCTTNFESSASEPFRWSLVGKNSGQEYLEKDLETLMERNLSIEVNISRKESILTIDGLDFPSIPDDIIVTCSSRLSDDDDDDVVSSSSTVRIGHVSDDVRKKDRVILGLSVTVGLFFFFFLLCCAVICLFCRICERKGKRPENVGQAQESKRLNVTREGNGNEDTSILSALGTSPDVTNVSNLNLELQPPLNDEDRLRHFPSIHTYETLTRHQQPQT